MELIKQNSFPTTRVQSFIKWIFVTEIEERKEHSGNKIAFRRGVYPENPTATAHEVN